MLPVKQGGAETLLSPFPNNIIRNHQAQERLLFRLLLPAVPPCLPHPLSALQNVTRGSIWLPQACQPLAVWVRTLYYAPERRDRAWPLDLGSRSKLDFGHWGSSASLSTPLSPRLPSMKWREPSSHIPNDGTCTESERRGEASQPGGSQGPISPGLEHHQNRGSWKGLYLQNYLGQRALIHRTHFAWNSPSSHRGASNHY